MGVGGLKGMVAALLMCAGVVFGQAAVPDNSDPLSIQRAQQEVFRRAARRVAPCVVTIETIGGTQPVDEPAPRQTLPSGPGDPPGRPPGPERGPGFIIADGPTTGLIWSADGLILTSAFNFVRDPSVITVILPDGRRFVGELLARDEVRRLAMVKIGATGLPVPEWVREADALRVGQWALALGRGFGGEDPSVSAGIISGLNRKGGVAVQTDAKLSPANFGGPLIDIQGRVLGICVPMGLGNDALAGVEWYDSGIGFAIPFWQAGKSAESLAVGHNLRRGLLGVQVDPRFKGGVRIRNLAEPSPASRAGLVAGDVILSFDGKPVREFADLQRLMSARVAGEKVAVRVRREQREMDLTVVLGVPEDMGPMPALEAETGPTESGPDPSRAQDD
jgi:serine protease Do